MIHRSVLALVFALSTVVVAAEQKLLIAPLDSTGAVHAGAWKMKNARAEEADGETPKAGLKPLRFVGEAEIRGAKGDFTIADGVPGKAKSLSVWVCLPENANVEKVGLQIEDGERERLLATVPADWTGWKQLTFNPSSEGFTQAYQQKDKNGKADLPLRSIHLVWFTKAPGETTLLVDAATAKTELDAAAPKGVTCRILSVVSGASGQPARARVLLTNTGDASAVVNVQADLRRVHDLTDVPLPDPVFGANHAGEAKVWILYDTEKVEDTTLTDAQAWTSGSLPYGGDYTEASQLVDLGRQRNITKMRWSSGDANHCWFVDVLASKDGKTFTPVAELQRVNVHKKWGWHTFPMKTPFDARYLKFRYHTGEPGKTAKVIRFPAELEVYDGVADEPKDPPKRGDSVATWRGDVTVPAHAYAEADIPLKASLKQGAYELLVRAAQGGDVQLAKHPLFVDGEPDASLVTPASRIGLNTSNMTLAPRLRDLGVGWVRFENGKWPMVSPRPHEYAFDGSVEPWKLDIDAIFETYRKNGLSVLTYMFLTPSWASTAPDEVRNDPKRKNRVITFPPKDPKLYGEFCFQTAARYGQTKQPAEKLLTTDKKSGLGLVKYYEMWNEPNLNPSPTASWGGWSAPLDEYYAMMRYGAEAVKRADPKAVVTSAGYAGMRADIVDRLRTYTYDDGKHPLDFIDLLNVHYYSGQVAPEIATRDGNANIAGSSTFVDDLVELNEWRDTYAPNMPIWMTETGYDSAGSFGTTEAIQAARLPRVVMLCLGYGVEKVFVYREMGSTASKHACSGVLRNDGSPKPSWYTFGTLCRQFKNVRGGAVRLPHPDPNVWLLKWDDGGKPLLTAWTVNGDATLGIDLGSPQIVDAFGGAVDAGNTRDLKLTPYPMYIRGMEASKGFQGLVARQKTQARKQEERRKKIRALKKHLYDFGTPEHVGSDAIEGVKTPYVAVGKDDLWDAKKGYGFDKPAMSVDDRKWMGRYRKLDRDSARLRDQAFRFRVQPGTYELAFSVEPFRGVEDIEVRGIGASPKTIPLKPARGEKSVVVKETFHVRKPTTISIKANGYTHLAWIRCVEALPKAGD